MSARAISSAALPSTLHGWSPAKRALNSGLGSAAPASTKPGCASIAGTMAAPAMPNPITPIRSRGFAALACVMPCAFVRSRRHGGFGRRGVGLDAVPPRTGPRHHLKISVQHLHGCAQAVLGILLLELARALCGFFRRPGPLMAPQA